MSTDNYAVVGDRNRNTIFPQGALNTGNSPGTPELCEILIQEIARTKEAFQILVDRAGPYLTPEGSATPKEMKKLDSSLCRVGEMVRQSIDMLQDLRLDVEAVTRRIDR